eukprot:TRINITY_DN2854_c3_g2_i3.p1 TRINITY_DN2854_c3_g2~~TRINITY_DN2854_c3_g2_i3.p1  ORF type:complete len:968 (-),score=202.60 TRINITY_DN2854_c3_g2_i3:1759-4542(-)
MSESAPSKSKTSTPELLVNKSRRSSVKHVPAIGPMQHSLPSNACCFQFDFELYHIDKARETWKKVAVSWQRGPRLMSSSFAPVKRQQAVWPESPPITILCTLNRDPRTGAFVARMIKFDVKDESNHMVGSTKLNLAEFVQLDGAPKVQLFKLDKEKAGPVLKMGVRCTWMKAQELRDDDEQSVSSRTSRTSVTAPSPVSSVLSVSPQPPSPEPIEPASTMSSTMAGDVAVDELQQLHHVDMAAIEADAPALPLLPATPAECNDSGDYRHSLSPEPAPALPEIVDVIASNAQIAVTANKVTRMSLPRSPVTQRRLLSRLMSVDSQTSVESNEEDLDDRLDEANARIASLLHAARQAADDAPTDSHWSNADDDDEHGVEQTRQLATTMQATQRRLLDVQGERDELQVQLGDLTQQISGLEVSVSELAAERDDALSAMEKISEQAMHIKQRLDGLEPEHASLLLKHRAAEHQIAALTEELQAAQIRGDDAQRSRRDTQQLLDDALLQSTRCRAQSMNEVSESDMWRKRAEEAERVRGELMKLRDEAEKALWEKDREMSARVKELRSSISEADKELGTSHETIRTLQKEIETQHVTIDALKQSNSDFVLEMRTTQAKYDALQLEHSQLLQQQQQQQQQQPAEHISEVAGDDMLGDDGADAFDSDHENADSEGDNAHDIPSILSVTTRQSLSTSSSESAQHSTSVAGTGIDLTILGPHDRELVHRIVDCATAVLRRENDLFPCSFLALVGINFEPLSSTLPSIGAFLVQKTRSLEDQFAQPSLSESQVPGKPKAASVSASASERSLTEFFRPTTKHASSTASINRTMPAAPALSQTKAPAAKRRSLTAFFQSVPAENANADADAVAMQTQSSTGTTEGTECFTCAQCHNKVRTSQRVEHSDMHVAMELYSQLNQPAIASASHGGKRVKRRRS